MKKIFALAVVAAVAAPAFAQSSVNVYGRLNITAESTKYSVTGAPSVTDNAINNNGSYLGFRGVEDLGGGLKAGFNIQHGLDPSTGAASGGTRFWNRESELYLQGNWGTVRLGSWMPETYLATADYISMHNHDVGLSADAFYVDSFATNKVGYRTPKLGSFQGELSVAEGKVYNLSGTMGMGAFELGAGYSETDGMNKQFALRANGNLGAFVVGAYYQRATDWMVGGINAGNRNSYRLSGMYTMGNTELHANFGSADSWSNVPDTSANQYTLGANYNLSKRTKVYGYYTAIDGTGYDMQSFALGVRHNF